MVEKRNPTENWIDEGGGGRSVLGGKIEPSPLGASPCEKAEGRGHLDYGHTGHAGAASASQGWHRSWVDERGGEREREMLPSQLRATPL